MHMAVKGNIDLIFLPEVLKALSPHWFSGGPFISIKISWRVTQHTMCQKNKPWLFLPYFKYRYVKYIWLIGCIQKQHTRRKEMTNSVWSQIYLINMLTGFVYKHEPVMIQRMKTLICTFWHCHFFFTCQLMRDSARWICIVQCLASSHALYWQYKTETFQNLLNTCDI